MLRDFGTSIEEVIRACLMNGFKPAIANWAPRFVVAGRRLQRLPARDRRARDVGRMAARLGGERRHARRARARGRGAGPDAHRRRGVGPRGARVPLREVRLDGRHGPLPRSRRRARDRGAPRGASPARPAAERIEIPFDGRHDGRQPPPAARRRPSAARPAATGARLDEGGVLRLGERLPPARHGDALARRPGPGRDRLHDSHIRPDYEVAVTAALDAPRSGPAPSARPACRSAATTRRVRRRSSRASVAVAGVSGPFNFGECWDERAVPDARDVPAPHRRVRPRRGARQGVRASTWRASRDRGSSSRCSSSPASSTGSSRGSRSKKIARRGAEREFVLYEEGNHVCNNIPYKYRPLVADWLREQLG